MEDEKEINEDQARPLTDEEWENDKPLIEDINIESLDLKLQSIESIAERFGFVQITTFITEQQAKQLKELADDRGLVNFNPIIREAIGFYFNHINKMKSMSARVNLVAKTAGSQPKQSKPTTGTKKPAK